MGQKFSFLNQTDQIREGNVVYIGQTNTEYCPIFWMRKYSTLSGLKDTPEAFLICRLAKTKTRHNPQGHLSICYTTARTTFLKHLSQCLEPKTYGLHSLRSGGASEAANNDVSDRLISKHGRWSSNTSRDTYIKDSSSKRYKVSQSLGI